MEKGGQKERKREGEVEKNLRKQGIQEWGRTETESKERHFLVEGAIIVLGINLALENSQESTRMNPAKTLSNRGEDVRTGLAL